MYLKRGNVQVLYQHNREGDVSAKILTMGRIGC